jgi:uncharacterized protein (TIGR03083 family)
MPARHIVDLTETARDAYAAAAETFVDTVGAVPGDSWDRAALGDWTVRDLVGHTARALTTVETYLDTETGTIEAGHPVEYYVRVMAVVDHDAIAERGRSEGRALGEDPHAAVVAIRDRVLGRLAHTEDEALLATPAGGMLLLDYLPTRTFELTVHTLDLAYALGLDTRTDPLPLASSLVIAAALAADRPDAAQVLLALTGRIALPERFAVF